MDGARGVAGESGFTAEVERLGRLASDAGSLLPNSLLPLNPNLRHR